jgi:superfamily II DNA/RNA helicase
MCQELLRLFARPAKSILVNVQHPKYLQLKNTLLEQIELNSSSDEPTRVMIFVNYRESARVLKDMIENDTELKDRFFPLTCVGKGKGNGSFEVMNDRQQQSAVRKFKNKDNACNVLIATSVLYEGIDVQACNAVVMFSSVPRGVAWIQAAGRARQKGSVTKIFYYEGCIEEDLANKSEKEANEIKRWIHEIEVGGAVNESCSRTTTNEEGETKNHNEEGETKSNWNASQNYVADLQEFTQKNLLPFPNYEFDVSTGLPCSSIVTVSGFVKVFHSKEESTIRLTTKKGFKQYVAHLWLEAYQNKVLEGNQAIDNLQQLTTIAPATPAIPSSPATFSNEWDSTKNYVAELQEYVAQTLRVALPVYAFDVRTGLPSSCSVTVNNDSVDFQNSTTVVNLTKKIQYKQHAAFLWLGKHRK